MAVQDYTGYAGWAVTAFIPVKFGTAHGRSTPEVGSTKCIDSNDRKGISRFSRNFDTSDPKIIHPTAFLMPIQNFFSRTVCS